MSHGEEVKRLSRKTLHYSYRWQTMAFEPVLPSGSKLEVHRYHVIPHMLLGLVKSNFHREWHESVIVYPRTRPQKNTTTKKIYISESDLTFLIPNPTSSSHTTQS